MKQFQKIPSGNGEAEYIEKKSRFISHVFYVETAEEANEKLAELRKKYWDATHNCYAYVLDSDNVMRFSDDGEPQGTAGMPILEVLKKQQVYCCLVVVTRYFGGTLLGAGGLVRAYAKGAKIGIGNGCGFTGTVIGAGKYISLGNNVRCGANTLITDSDWHSDDYRTGEDKPVIIEDNVWLGYGVKVLKGVRIGKNSLIGANSVVTRDIPANVVAVGNPCRIIKHLEPQV